MHQSKIQTGESKGQHSTNWIYEPILLANTLHNKLSAYWFASRWVASLNVDLDVHLPRIRMLTAFQELRRCPGSTCPWIQNYNWILSKDCRRHNTWIMRYQNNTGETLLVSRAKIGSDTYCTWEVEQRGQFSALFQYCEPRISKNIKFLALKLT